MDELQVLFVCLLSGTPDIFMFGLGVDVEMFGCESCDGRALQASH